MEAPGSDFLQKGSYCRKITVIVIDVLIYTNGVEQVAFWQCEDIDYNDHYTLTQVVLIKMKRSINDKFV